jgi:hypothetical protein
MPPQLKISILNGKKFQKILGQILGIFFKNSRGRGMRIDSLLIYRG